MRKLLIHSVGLLSTALICATLTFGLVGMAHMLDAIRTDQLLRTMMLGGIIFHLGLSLLAWLSIYGVYRRIRRAQKKPMRVVRLSRGTALTEFLIVLGPMLLLISGLAQLSILNTAGLLTDLASYNAARAVWVWEPQDMGQVQPRAQLAAAMAVAPTAPSDYATAPHPDVQFMVETMGGVVGAAGGDQPSPVNVIFARAFDTGTFAERSAKKLYFAYRATEVTPLIGGGEVGAQVTYNMNLVFPWFGWVWSDTRTVAGRTGYYSAIQRTYILPEQPRPRAGGWWP